GRWLVDIARTKLALVHINVFFCSNIFFCINIFFFIVGAVFYRYRFRYLWERIHMVVSPCVSSVLTFWTLNPIQPHLPKHPHRSHVSCPADSELISYMRLPHYPVLGQALQVNPNRQG